MPTPRKATAPRARPAKKAAPAAPRGPAYLARVPKLATNPSAPEAAEKTNPKYGTTNGGYGRRYVAEVRRGARFYTAAMGPAPANGYEMNCTNCVMAFEMRMRGYDVSATPTPFLSSTGRGTGRPHTDMDAQLDRNWRLPDGRAPSTARSYARQPWRTQADIIREVERTWPEGGRGVVMTETHVYNVVKQNGRAVYLEAQVPSQRGQDLTADYRRRYRRVKLMRLDDLVPHDGIRDVMVW